jgi:DNA-binding NarL/FixJ family response regulator
MTSYLNGRFGKNRQVTTDPPPVRVLVADDSAGVRELLVMLLNMESAFTVVGEARDGLAAVALAESLQPDLVILDVNMPRLDGIEALPRVRDASPQSHVVIFSGNVDDDGLEREARAAGADAVISKDTGALTLIERLAKLFAPCGELPATG